MEYIIALLALTLLEIVLGIDNIVFIAILTDRLPEEQRPRARRMGLTLALVMRLLLLLSLAWLLGLEEDLFDIAAFGVSPDWIPLDTGVSGKDLILFAGGLFLIWKSVSEIHKSMEAEGEDKHGGSAKSITMSGVLLQIAIMDLVFSLDSVITAVGTVPKNDDKFWVGVATMAAAIIIAVLVMLMYANPVSQFVSNHPTVKMLALSFLILIGVMLIAESVGTPIPKGYIYFSMAFAIIVELLNLRVRSRRIADT